MGRRRRVGNGLDGTGLSYAQSVNPKMLIEISEIRGLFLSGMPLQKAVGLCIIQTQNRVCRLCGF